MRQVTGRGICFLLLFLPCILWTASADSHKSSPSSALATKAHSFTTWFIRPDGGDRRQCTGKADAAYSGKGNSQPCAFKNPYYLFTNDDYNNKQWIIAGGDTILIRGLRYRMGYKGPNPHDMWGSCPGDPYGCGMPALPSGTPDHPTRLLGEHFANCSQKTQLFGGYALGSVIALEGSQNVHIECLELTGHSQCTRVGAGHPASEGCSSTYPLSDYASVGITTDHATSNVVLKNLDIHGFASRGIIGAIGGPITADHVRIAFNAGAGWDFDDGKATPSTADAIVHASYLTVEWNGCNEEFPHIHPIPAYSCFDQDSGGYGDGIGTPNTPLSFTCDHCIFRYNTQDGFDLLHVSGSLISITNSTAYGNMGQQWKMGPMHQVIFRNNVTVHNCSRMSAPMFGVPDNYHRYLSLFCRAAGDGIAFEVTNGGTYLFQNNSFAGYGASSYDITCSGNCTQASIVYQNNLNIGYPSPTTGDLPGVFYTADVPWTRLFFGRSHNIYYRMRSCPPGWTEHCVNPQIANLPVWTGEASLDSIDFHLTGSSPARGAGVTIPELTTDHDGVARPNNSEPSNSAPDIGAFQYHP